MVSLFVGLVCVGIGILLLVGLFCFLIAAPLILVLGAFVELIKSMFSK